MDKTLDAAGVLRKLKDQTFTIVSSRSGPVQVSSGPVPACTVQFPPVPSAYSRNGLKAWYCPGEYDLISLLWLDCSGNGNWALLSGTGFEKVVGKGNGAYNNVSALHGTTKSTIRFGTHNNVIQSEFTVCSVTRYTGGGPQGRILQASIDWLHGHFAGLAGVAFYGKWVTAKTPTPGNVRPNTNWLVMCGTNAGAGSQLKLANGKSVGTAEGGGGDASLWVNGGQFAGSYPGNEASHFAIAEVVVWSRGLTNAEMTAASNYLMNSRGIQSPTST